MTYDVAKPEPRSACQANSLSVRTPPTSQSGADALPAQPEFSCLICSGPMFGVHCKLICRHCGYREDCSDLFPA